MPQQAQVKGKKTGTQRCAQEQRRDRRERRKTKDPSTTRRCAQINTARPASNPDTLTLPPANQDATSSRREKKKMAEKEKGRKQGRVERHIDHVKWTAWLARQIMMQVQKQNIDLDVIVQLNSSSPAASSKRSSTDSFRNPKVCYTARSPTSLQLCQALGQLRNSPLGMPPRTARRQGPAPVSCHGGHFLLRWLRGETTTTPTDVDWHWRALVEASSCPLRQMSHCT